MKGVAVRPTRRIIYLLTAVLVVVLGISGLLCAKQIGQMSRVGAEIKDRRAELTKRKGLARDLNSAMLELERARAKVRHLERRVTEKDYVPTLLGQIEELASSCDLRVTDVEPKEKKAVSVAVGPPMEGAKGPSKPTDAAGAKPGAKPDAAADGDKQTIDVNKLKAASEALKGPYRSETIDVTVYGTYWNVVRFITKLTEFPKILAVTSVKVDQKKAGVVGSSPVLSVRIVLDAYVLDDKKPASKPKQPSPTQPGAGSGGS